MSSVNLSGISKLRDSNTLAAFSNAVFKEDSKVHGIPVIDGENVVVAPPRYIEIVSLDVEVTEISDKDLEYEISLLAPALKQAHLEINRQIEACKDEAGKVILNAHRLMCDEIISDAQKKFMIQTDPETARKGYYSAGTAISMSADYWHNIYSSSTSELTKGFAGDTAGLKKLLLLKLFGFADNEKMATGHEHIVIAEEISPSLAIAAEPRWVKGVITCVGGSGGHAFARLKAKGIPYITGVSLEDLKRLKNAALIAMDGEIGEAFANPSEDTIKKMLARPRKPTLVLKSAPPEASAETMDGVEISIGLTVSDFAQTNELHNLNNAGVGLYRSEDIGYDDLDAPSANDQLARIGFVVISMDGKPVRVRTYDIGGDKIPKWYKKDQFGPSEVKGVELSMYNEYNNERFKANIEGILRASAIGNVEMLFPMVKNAEQFLDAVEVVNSVKADLKKGAFNPEMKIGAMIESPIAVHGLDAILDYADFISIGSNDMKYDLLHLQRDDTKHNNVINQDYPAIIAVYKYIIKKCDERNIPVTLCGEDASDPLKIPILIGCGLRNFSVAPECVGPVKTMISLCDSKECAELVSKIEASPGPKTGTAVMEAELKKLKVRAVERNLLRETLSGDFQ